MATLDAPRLLGEISGLRGSAAHGRHPSAKRRASSSRLSATSFVAFGRRSPALLLAAIEQLGRRIGTINEALGLYANALAALEERGFDEGVLADLNSPAPALATFAAAFRRFAKRSPASGVARTKWRAPP